MIIFSLKKLKFFQLFEEKLAVFHMKNEWHFACNEIVAVKTIKTCLT